MKSAIKPQDGLRETGVVLLGTLILLLPAIYNAFPLMYSDSGAYLAAAFEGRLPLGRPVAYGWFIRYTSMHFSLWLTLVVQCLIAATLLRQTLQSIRPLTKPDRFYLSLVLLLTLGTGIGWYAGQLMPDIFAGLLPLTVFLLVFGEGWHWGWRFFWAALLFLFCVTHYSHAFLGLGLLTLLMAWLWRGKRRQGSWRVPPMRLLWSLLPALMAVATFFAVNKAEGFGWKMTRSSHVYTMGRMAANGILEDYLDEVCAYAPNVLCPYKNELPNSAVAFIWSDQSPFKKTGYWKNSADNYNAILADLLSRPKYLLRFAWESAKAGAAQLLQVDVGEGLSPYGERSAPDKFFQRAWPELLPKFRGARQIAGDGLGFGWTNLLNYLLLGFSIVYLVLLLAWRRDKLTGPLLGLVVVVLLAFLLNALLTGALANPYARLQARVAWMLPLVAIALAWKWGYKEKEQL